MEPSRIIDYLRGTANNLDLLVGRDPDTDEGAIDEDVALNGVEALEMIDKLRAAADDFERMQGQVAAFQEWSKALAGYISAMHKPPMVDDASVAILDGYHVGLTPVAGPRDGGENTLAAALRLLKLAKDRGAFDPRSSPEFIREGYGAGVPTGTRDERQALIASWTSAVFGADMMAPHERIMRFVEEAIELAQAEGLPVERVEDIASYVYARPVGDPAQELGGVGLTLLAYAAAKGLSADDAEAAEVIRVLRKDPNYFRKRNLEKAAAGIGDYKGQP